MEIIIESPHFSINELLREYTIKKAAKLAHIDERLIKCLVLLKLDKSGQDDNKICEIKINGPRKNLFAESRALTFEDCITDTIHALEKQLKKEKTKARRDGKKMQIETDQEETE